MNQSRDIRCKDEDVSSPSTKRDALLSILTDPCVRSTIQDYECQLALFMSTLSSRLGLYNQHLKDMLPHSTRAARCGDTSGSRDRLPHIFHHSSTPHKLCDLTVKLSLRTATEPAPRSPLLRRPMLKQAELEELNIGAQNELKQRICNEEDEKSMREATSVSQRSQPREMSLKAPQLMGNAPVQVRLSKMKRSGRINGNKTAGEKVLTAAQILRAVDPSPMLLKQLRIIKKEALDLSQILDQIHDLIAMRAPAFGVGDARDARILQSLIEAISTVNDSANELYDMEREYVKTRAGLEARYLKNYSFDSAGKNDSSPGTSNCIDINETNKLFISAYDESRWDSIEAGWRIMIRGVVILHSKLAQNMNVLRTKSKKVFPMTV